MGGQIKQGRRAKVGYFKIHLTILEHVEHESAIKSLTISLPIGEMMILYKVPHF